MLIKSKHRYRISEKNDTWPIRNIETSDGEFLDNYALLMAPPRTEGDIDFIRDVVNRKISLIGVSTYENFPQRTVWPGRGDIEKNFDLWGELGPSIKGWLYNARNLGLILPEGLPNLLMANSDFTNPERIRPDLVDHITLNQSKKYDFLYVCRDSRWNEYCRNWHTGVRCIKKLARAGYKVAVVGHQDSQELVSSRYIKCLPALGWYKFLATIRSSRCLLVPNIYDASPRILAQALCLDVPILVNKHIVGGWKYVNAATGRFFSSDEHIVEIAGSLLCDQTLSPREYFKRYYGPENAGRALYKFIQHIDQTNSANCSLTRA